MNPREVNTVREKEMKYLWDMEVYEYFTEAEARARTGRNPVGLKWIETNKGSAEAPRCRSRLVCTEVRHKGVEPIFSATLPLKTLRILLSVASEEDVFRVEDRFLISIADVSRAHFHANAVRDVYVRLPDEDAKAKQPGVWRETSKDNVRTFGRSPTTARALRSSFGGERIFPRRGISVPFLPQGPGDVYSGARKDFSM